MSTQGKSLQDEVEDGRRNKRKKVNITNKKEAENQGKNKEVIKNNKNKLNEEDMKLNEEDKEYIPDDDSYTSDEGHEEVLPKKNKAFRIIVQNVSTIDPRNNFYKLYTHRKELQTMEGDAYLFCETNTNAWFPKIKKILKKTTKFMFKKYSIDLGSCKNNIKNKIQPGGVCSIFRDKAAATTKNS
jgi:hypothetical protein